MARRRRRHVDSFATFFFVGVALVLTVAVLRGCAAVPRSASTAPAAAEHHTASNTGGARVEPRNSLAGSPHVALGIPVDATPSDDLLLDERDFVLSFNTQRLDPNWVAWQLDVRYLGQVHRKDNFRADDSLPLDVHHVTPHDYLHSGYDRGHMCPSADRDATEEMNSLTFVMTNMVPQVHELNAGPWEKLEEHERELAARPDSELYIVAGPIFDSNPKTIGRGVAVPKATYKIICALTNGQTSNDVRPSTPVISVIIPNEAEVGREPWTAFATTVDEIEKQTGYDFLRAVPDDVETILEAKVSSTE